jgi:hypothetical protein
MGNILATKIDDFAVALDRGVIVFTTILAYETFHQPRFGELGRNVQNSVEKDLRHFPPFFGNRSCGMSPINADNRVLGLSLWWSRLSGSFVVE